MISGAPKDLVYPLIDSVKHEMTSAKHNAVPLNWNIKLSNLEEALEKTFNEPHVFEMPRLLSHVKNLSEVRSVQRIPLRRPVAIRLLAESYFRWLPSYLYPFLRVSREGELCSYHLRFTSLLLLSLRYNPKGSSDDRVLYKIEEGCLVGKKQWGRLSLELDPVKNF